MKESISCNSTRHERNEENPRNAEMESDKLEKIATLRAILKVAAFAIAPFTVTTHAILTLCPLLYASFERHLDWNVCHALLLFADDLKPLILDSLFRSTTLT